MKLWSNDEWFLEKVIAIGLLIYFMIRAMPYFIMYII